MFTTALDAQRWQHRLVECTARHRVPGAALGIARTGSGVDDEVIVTCGVLNKETGVEATPDSLFQIGSITKTWTATAVMQLVDEGRVHLDRPVIEVLPELRLDRSDAAERTTMRHLLTHTSGMAGDVFTDTGRGDDCVERYVATLADTPRTHPVGATWSYCNAGFVVAGRVIERLTGMNWDTAMRERLFEPLGVTHTVTLPEEALLHRTAVGHMAEDGQDPRRVSSWGLTRAIGPAGLINSAPRDVLTFARMHLDGGRADDGTRVLSHANIAAMRSPQANRPDAYPPGDSSGLGWRLSAWDGQPVFGHDGSTRGQDAFLRILPGKGLAVVLLTNGGNARDLSEDLFREVFRDVAAVELPAPLQVPADPPALDCSPYLGTYERAGARTEIFERDGLVLRQTVTGPLADLAEVPTHEYALRPVRAGLFAMRSPHVRTWSPVTFYNLPDGTAYVHYSSRANPKVG